MLRQQWSNLKLKIDLIGRSRIGHDKQNQNTAE